MQSGRVDPFSAPYECSSSRYLTVGGTRLHYCVEGRGPVVLLLHGLFSSLHSWDGWVRELSSSYRLVRVDLPGFGLSDHLRSDDYSPEYAVEFIEQLRVQLELDRFHLVGNCLGGFLSWYYAANHPESVDKLILIAPLGYPERLPPLLELFSLPLLGRVTAAMTPRRLLSRSVRALYGRTNDELEQTIDQYTRLIKRGRNQRAFVKTCRQLRLNRKDEALRMHIHRVKADALLMWGENDPVVPAQQLEAWCRDLPSARVQRYAGAGHMPMEELPERSASDASAFLAGAPAQELEQSGEEPALGPVFARGA